MLSTRLTDALGIRYPIVSAPMALAAGGALAAAVTRAGGLGLIGGGYGDRTWLREQFDVAGCERVGVGFITWSAQQSPESLAEGLERRPAAVMLSFGSPSVFATVFAKPAQSSSANARPSRTFGTPWTPERTSLSRREPKPVATASHAARSPSFRK